MATTAGLVKWWLAERYPWKDSGRLKREAVRRVSDPVTGELSAWKVYEILGRKLADLFFKEYLSFQVFPPELADLTVRHIRDGEPIGPPPPDQPWLLVLRIYPVEVIERNPGPP